MKQNVRKIQSPTLRTMRKYYIYSWKLIFIFKLKVVFSYIFDTDSECDSCPNGLFYLIEWNFLLEKNVQFYINFAEIELQNCEMNFVSAVVFLLKFLSRNRENNAIENYNYSTKVFRTNNSILAFNLHIRTICMKNNMNYSFLLRVL